MKAVVKLHDGAEGWEIKDVDRIAPKEDEVEIEIKAAGICGSELHLYHDNHFYDPGAVVGHEFSGVISKLGEKVTGWHVGDRVVAENHKTSCGVCDFCKTGHPMFCKKRKSVGYAVNGGWTSYVTMPAKYLLSIPEGVSFEEAAMTEPCTILVHALCFKQPICVGETVLINGCGTIGLIGAMVAKAAGAGKVIITGTNIDVDKRFPVCRAIGVDHIINVEVDDILKEVEVLTNGMGVDFVVEASGAPSAISISTKILRKNGRIVAIGEAPSNEIRYDWNASIFKAATIAFTYGADYPAWKLSLELMKEKKLNLIPLITHRLTMYDFKKGFELLESKQAIKVIMLPEW